MQEQEPWVSVEGVTRHLGIAKDTVYRWIEKKALPAHRVGRLWKFKLTQVDAWIEAGGAAESEHEREPQVTTASHSREQQSLRDTDVLGSALLSLRREGDPNGPS